MTTRPTHSKISVNYSRGMMAAHCGICRYFIAPASCEKVIGKISPEDWCKLFKKKEKENS